MRFSVCKLAITFFLAGLGLNAQSADTPYYTWTDRNGVVNYSQQKPSGVNAELIVKEFRFGRKRVEEKSVVNLQMVDSSTTSKNDVPDRAQKAIEEIEKVALEIKKVKKTNCEQARKNLTSYVNRGRIRVVDKNGEYRILSTEERQAAIDRYQGGIDENC